MARPGRALGRPWMGPGLGPGQALGRALGQALSRALGRALGWAQDPKNKKQTFDAGTIICKKDEVYGDGIGRITSVTHSPELGHWIGLGFIEGGYENWKDQVVIGADPVRNNEVEIEIVSPHMIDPEGKRMHG